MTREPRDIALSYITACGRKDLDTVATLLSPEVQFVGPNGPVRGAAPYLAILRRLGAVWEGSEVKHVFCDGPEVCVIYDLVTSTAAGAVPIVEVIDVRDGAIASIRILFDRVAFKPAADELARRG